MNRKQKVLILAEAGDKIGLGHYTRCIAIQSFLKSENIDCSLVLNLKGAYQLTFDGLLVNWLDNLSFVRKVVKEETAKVLVDSYLATSEDFLNLRKAFQKVFVIDDYNRIHYHADIIFNPNVFAPKLDYSNQRDTKVFGGKDYVILRKAFRDRVPSKLTEKVQHVTITVGGSDYRNILPKLSTIVKESFPNVDVSVVTGNSNLKNQLQEIFKDIEILSSLTDEEMYTLFDNADIVISACGQSLHELASMGKPTIGVCLDIDQQPNQEFYHQIGFLKEKIKYDNLTPVQQQLNELMNFEERKQLHRIGQNAFNKNGVEQICNIIMS